MPTAKLAAWAVDAGVIGAVILVAWLALSYFGGKAVDTIQAPAKLDAALGNNAALAAGVGAQNKAVDALPAAAAEKKKKSADAVAKAGEPELAAAKRIQSTKAAGATPLERAANRINAEFAQ
jgi:hypothetical protein